MFLQPCLNLGRLVRGVVVENKMHIAAFFTAQSMRRKKRRNSLAPPLVVCMQTTAGQLMARQAFSDDQAGFDVERC
jgi:hypothetical protein